MSQPSEAQKIAEHYFTVSNKSDFDEIAKLLTPTTTYSSATTGMYLGREAILEMQRAFHGSFAKLHWTVNEVNELRPGIICFDYDFASTKLDGSEVTSSGLEYVLVVDGKIQHIEIRGKAGH